MKRRTFLGVLAALPFLGGVKATAQSKGPKLKYFFRCNAEGIVQRFESTAECCGYPGKIVGYRSIRWFHGQPNTLPVFYERTVVEMGMNPDQLFPVIQRG